MDNGFLWIDHPKIHYGVNFYKNIVVRNNVLAGHIHDHGTQVDSDHLLNTGDYDDQARAFAV